MRRPAAAVETDDVKAAEALDPTGATTIVYVHGIGNKPPASVLKAQWDHALFGFDLGERSRMAYWVDRDRYPVPLNEVSLGGDYADGSENAPTGELTPKEVSAAWSPQAELAKLQPDIQDLTGAPTPRARASRDSQRLTRLAQKMLGQSNLPDDERFGQLAVDLRGGKGEHLRRIQAQRYGASSVQAKIFDFLPRPMRQWLTRNVTRMFLRDVNDLFVDKAKGAVMLESLRERLRAGGGPFVVVAHSQGTMIAYAVLMEPEFRDLDVALFVTIGSPLGITEVQDYIRDLSGARKLVVPAPLEPAVILALFFARVTSSGTDLTGTVGCTTSTSGTDEIHDTGTRSLTGSKAIVFWYRVTLTLSEAVVNKIV